MLDWFIENEGPSNVVGSYFIDVYLDEILAERWSGSEISPNHFLSVDGFAELLDLFHLEPGTHTVKLVADPTNLINETSETENTYSAEFTWSGEAVPTPIAGTRLPNLSITTGAGDPEPMIVSPFPGADSSGGLSIHGDTHISISILNDSPIPIERDFSIYILFDDLVVRRANYSGLLGGSKLTLDWDGLGSSVPITAGTHTLKLIADATSVIFENNEDDNTYEIELAWGADSPLVKPESLPAPAAPSRSPQALANLTAYVPYGWEAAISVSNTSDALDLGVESPAWTSSSATISFSIRNASHVSSAPSSEFRAEVWIDDNLYGSKLFSAGSDAGAFWKESITVPADQITAGQHLVKVVIDSEQTIPEDSESDNSFARYVTWNEGSAPVVAPEDFTLSDEQLDALLAPVLETLFIDQVRPAAESGMELPDWIPAIESAGKAGYYLLTGNDLDAERIVVNFLPHDQFMAASLNACMTGFGLLSDPVYTATFDNCLLFRGEVGFEKRIDGKNHVFVDLGSSPIEALGTYFHELGHALQDLTNPEISTAVRTSNIRALLEAQAQIFEAAALRAIEDHSGISLMKFPDAASMQTSVNFHLDNTNALIGSAEHTLGYKMLWMESLANTSGLGTNTELLNNKRLSSTTAKGLFDYLVAMNSTQVDAWISQIFSVGTRADQFINISRSRMESDLPTADYGNPGLLESAFLAP